MVVIAGGLGLAPLRPVIYQLIENRLDYGKVTLLYGARSPADILFASELTEWRSRLDIGVEVTVDHADRDWHGHVGVVTQLLRSADFDPAKTTAFVCGPEIMMRFAANGLTERRRGPERHLPLDGAQHEMRHRPLRPLPVRAAFRLQGRPGVRL